MTRLAVFDLDGTLLAGDSTLAWVRALLLSSWLRCIAAAIALPAWLFLIWIPSTRKVGASILLWIATVGYDQDPMAHLKYQADKQGYDQMVEAWRACQREVVLVTNEGETAWHGFAAAIFAGWARRGRRVPALEAITTAQYPTAPRRPANSRLDCSKVARVFGLRLPAWRSSLERCLDEIAEARAEAQA